MKQSAVYIITNKRNGTLYTDVIFNLMQRISQHKKKEPGFPRFARNDIWE